jgi:hypothetical protein
MAQAASAEEYYFTLVFGSQSHPKQLRYTHTWATFIRAVGSGPDLTTYDLYVHTISWLPATLNVRVWALNPEPGVNLDLYQTMNAVLAKKENIDVWGPFLIRQEVYERSLIVKAYADSGAVQYRAISARYDLLVADCIHAVAAVDPVFGRGHYPLIRIGKPASRYIAKQLMKRSHYDQKLYDNSWLISRLGLCAYPVRVISPQELDAKMPFLREE